MSLSTSAAPIYPAHAASSPQFGRGAGLKLWMLPVIGLLTACSPKLQKGDTYTVIPADRFEAVAGSIVKNKFAAIDEEHKHYERNQCSLEAYQALMDSLDVYAPISHWNEIQSEAFDYPKSVAGIGVTDNGDDVLRTVTVEKDGEIVFNQRVLTDSTVTKTTARTEYNGDGFVLSSSTQPLSSGLAQVRTNNVANRTSVEATLAPMDEAESVPSDSTAVLPVPVKKTKKGKKRRSGNPGNSGGN